MASRIYIVEDHPLMREMLQEYVEEMPGYTVCGTTGTAEEALDDLKEAEAALVIVDVSLPGMSGIELMKKLQARDAPPPCLAYSGHNEARYARQAFDAGARGYLIKGDPEELSEAIRHVLEGRRYVSALLRDKAIDFHHGERAG